MTDQEKTLEFLKMLAEKAKEDAEIEIQKATMSHQQMVNAYMKAGFTRKEAIQITTELLKAAIKPK